MSRSRAIIIILVLILVQTIYSFRYPVFDPANTCQHSSDYFLGTNLERMRTVFGVSGGELSLTQKFFSWFPDYRMICDSTSFLLLAKNWPASYNERNIYIDQPLYNMFAALALAPWSWLVGAPNYPFIFGVLIAVNLALFAATAVLFYLLLLNFFSGRVAFWSAVLLVFSPFTHSLINQPTNSGMMEIFVVAAALWLLSGYVRQPSGKRLVVFSLAFGVLLLGKQIMALSLFVLLLAVYFKRYKEGLWFLALQFVPTLAWFLYVRYGLDLPYYSASVSVYDQGTWFLKARYWQFYEMSNILVSAIPKFFSNLIYGFILIPVAFSFYGLYRLDLKYKYLLYFGLFASFFMLFFAMNYFRASLSFLLFPAVYPTAIIGIEKIGEYLKRYGDSWPRTFFYLVILVIVFFSSLNYILLIPQN